jgi:lipopolysaccharide transport system permease protein
MGLSYSNFRAGKIPFVFQYLLDVVRFRHLCWNLAGSDLRSRFRRSRLGILWAIIQPLSFALILAFVYARLFGEASYWTYAIYVFGGMLVWEYFTSASLSGLDALVGSQGYLKQARIPFFIFQLRVPLAGMVTFFFGLCGLYGLMLVLQAIPGSGVTVPVPGLHLLLVPAMFGVLLLFSAPWVILLSTFGAQFRDVKYITMIALQLLFFISPIMIARDFMDSPHLAILRVANPLVPLLDMLREPVIYGRFWSEQSMIVMGVWIGVLWVIAIISSVSFGRRLVYAL